MKSFNSALLFCDFVCVIFLHFKCHVLSILYHFYVYHFLMSSLWKRQIHTIHAFKFNVFFNYRLYDILIKIKSFNFWRSCDCNRLCMHCNEQLLFTGNDLVDDYAHISINANTQLFVIMVISYSISGESITLQTSFITKLSEIYRIL